METSRGPSCTMFGFSVLYTLQGLPYGLQSRFLPLYFQTHGMSLTDIGLYKLLLIPWVLKFLWAPAVDNMEDTKHTWVKRSLIALVALCLFSSGIDPKDSTAVSFTFFLFNLITSVQDIVIDTLLIETSRHSDLLSGNTIQVVAAKVGSMITGGLYIMYIETLTWSHIFNSLAFQYFLGFIVWTFFTKKPVCLFEPAPSPSSEFENEANIGIFCKVQRKIDRYVNNVFKAEGTTWMLKLLLVYKLGEVGFGNAFPMFLVDEGISASTVGFWTGVVTTCVSILGSSLGAIILPTRNLMQTLQVYMIASSLIQVVILFSVISWNGSDLHFWISIFVFVLKSFFGGTITTCIFTLAMQVSQKAPRNYQACHYTCLTTVEVLGKLLFASAVGAIIDYTNYTIAFTFFTILSFMILPLFYKKVNIE